jgi:hypothetical protein
MRDKLLRDQMAQQNIADTIKQIQQQRASGAYLEAARQAGVLPEGALEGVDSPYAATAAGNLAKLLLAKREEDRRAAAAQTYPTQIGDETYPLTQDQRVRLAIAAQAAKQRAGDVADSTEPETFTDDKGITWRKHYDARGRVNWYPVKTPTVKEPTPATTKTEMANLGVTGQDILNPAIQYGTLPSGERVPPGQPWTAASTIHIQPESGAEVPLSIEKFRALKKALGVPDPNPTPAPTGTPGAQPDVTVTPPPGPVSGSAGVRQADVNQASAASNLAPGYGVPAEIAPSRDAAKPGQTYYAPDGSVRVRGND